MADWFDLHRGPGSPGFWTATVDDPDNPPDVPPVPPAPPPPPPPPPVPPGPPAPPGSRPTPAPPGSPVTPGTPWDGKDPKAPVNIGGTKSFETFTALFRELAKRYPGTRSGLEQLLKDHPWLEFELAKNAAGEYNGKIRLPAWAGGGLFDMIIDADNSQGGAGWNLSFAQGGDGAGAGSGGELGALGTVLDPWTTPFEYPSFEPPPAFQAPTWEEAASDPAYQFALSQGEQALQRSAAAKGTLLTTGTLKDLSQFNQGLASEQYDKTYGRKLGEYQLQGGLMRGDWATDYNKALGEFRQGYDIWAANQDRPFNKLTTLAGLGVAPGTSLLGAGSGYMGQYGNTMLGGANTLADLMLQGANSRAAGFMGAGNNWNQFYQSMSQLAPFYGAFSRSGYR